MSQLSVDMESSSELQKIISKYPDLAWDWNALSYNLSLSAEFLIENINKPMDMYKLSANPVIGVKHLDLHPYVAWKYDGYSININLPVEIIKASINKWDVTDNIPLVKWNYYYLSINPAISCEYIRDNILQQWNWAAIAKREDLDAQFVQDYEVFLTPNGYRGDETRGEFLENYWRENYPNNLVYLPYLRDDNARKRLKTFIREDRRSYYAKNAGAAIDLGDIDWDMVSLLYTKITVEFFEKYRSYLNIALLSKNTACQESRLQSEYARKVYYMIQFMY